VTSLSRLRIVPVKESWPKSAHGLGFLFICEFPRTHGFLSLGESDPPGRVLVTHFLPEEALTCYATLPLFCEFLLGIRFEAAPSLRVLRTPGFFFPLLEFPNVPSSPTVPGAFVCVVFFFKGLTILLHTWAALDW